LETLHPKEIELGLKRVSTVAERMGLLSPTAKVITVAGTNGKGSCVRTMEALLAAQNISCGAYTSPHLRRYNERVRLNAVEASDQALCEAFAEINAARAEISLTYFEFATLAALTLFQKHQLDYWLLEVGLGGRLDAVNILDPDVAVITQIDLDHQEWLGDTREVIAVEKAGILRSGMPCIIADEKPPGTLTAAAEGLACSVYQYDLLKVWPTMDCTQIYPCQVLLRVARHCLYCLCFPKRLCSEPR